MPLAREFVRALLREWGAEHLFDEASLIVTELAANAVLHAGSPYEVRLTHVKGVLRIEVADEDPGTPEPQPFSAVAESGRGIVLVSAVSASWGIDARPDGKVTWAELGRRPAQARLEHERDRPVVHRLDAHVRPNTPRSTCAPSRSSSAQTAS